MPWRVKKNPFLSLSITAKEEKKKTIGIIGTHAGVGVTYLGWILSMYLSQKKRKRTAYLELSGKNDFYYIQKKYCGDNPDWAEKRQFERKKLTCFCQVKEEDIGTIWNSGYDYIVVDFGSQIQKRQNEFLHCDEKIVLCSQSVWHKPYFEQFKHRIEYIPNYKEWNYFIMLGTKETAKQWGKKENIQFQPVPFLSEELGFYEEVEQLFRSLI